MCAQFSLNTRRIFDALLGMVKFTLIKNRKVMILIRTRRVYLWLGKNWPSDLSEQSRCKKRKKKTEQNKTKKEQKWDQKTKTKAKATMKTKTKKKNKHTEKKTQWTRKTNFSCNNMRRWRKKKLTRRKKMDMC